MACLGPSAMTYQVSELVGRPDTTALLEAASQSPHLEVDGGRISWKAGALHPATLRLVQEHPDLVRKFVAERAFGLESTNRLRLSCYLDDEAGFWTHRHTGEGASADWAVRFFTPLDEPFVVSRPPAIRQALLDKLAPTLWTAGRWSPTLQETVRRLPRLDTLACQLAAARGEGGPALTSALKTSGYDALRSFFAGLKSDASQGFAKRIARRKAGVPALDAFVGVFARLAALSQGDVVLFGDPRLASPAMPWLDRLLATLAEHLQQPMEPGAFAARVNLDQAGPGLDWAVAAALRNYLPITVEPPTGLADDLRERGLVTLADQLGEAPAHPWLEGHVTEPWRLWLATLRSSCQSRPATLPAETEEGELAWHIGWGGSLWAHAQRYGRDGPVSFSSLLKKPPAYLSLQDRVVLGKLKTHRHGEPSVTPEALQALVGHPRVFHEGRRCELVEEPQKLKIQRTPAGLSLAFSPDFPDDKLYVVRRGAGDRAVLTVASQWHSILRPLLKLDHALPPEAEEELRGILAGWPDGMELCYGKGVAPLVTTPLKLERLVLRASPRGAALKLAWAVRPQAESPDLALPALSGPEGDSLHWEGVNYAVARDHAREQEQLSLYWARCPLLPRETDFLVADMEAALELLEQLKAAAIPLEWSEGAPWRLRPPATRAGLTVRAQAGGDWFALDGELRLDEALVIGLGRALELSRAYPGRYLRLGESDFVLLEEGLRQQLTALNELVDEDAAVLRLPALAVPTLAELELVQLHGDEGFWRILERFAAAAALEAPVPATLQTELREYQREGYAWLAQRAELGVGACLADDMGLGKTLQALALMLKEQGQGPHLVICPTSVTTHWLREVGRFAPTLEPCLHEGKERQHRLAEPAPGQVVITSYRMFLQDWELLTGQSWNVALLDEAQFIKNPDSKTARACFQLRARVRIATTGTPVENRLSELWSIFRFLNPGLLGSLASFRRRFEQPDAEGSRGLRRLKRVVAPFLLRRLKTEVLSELPPRTELTLTVDLSAEERALYESVRRQAEIDLEEGDAVRLLAHLTRLRQACCHPRLLLDQGHLRSSKFEVVLDLLADLRAGRHRALVFSQFTSLLDLLEEELAARGTAYLRLDGSTPSALRRERVASFQEGRGDVFLISLKAGGTGLNLTAADYVVHLDPWWNPAVEDQATDRAHRLGQTRPVTVYRILASDTIEEKVLGLHGRKRALAQGILDGQSMASPLDLGELRALLGLEFRRELARVDPSEAP